MHMTLKFRNAINVINLHLTNNGFPAWRCGATSTLGDMYDDHPVFVDFTDGREKMRVSADRTERSVDIQMFDSSGKYKEDSTYCPDDICLSKFLNRTFPSSISPQLQARLNAAILTNDIDSLIIPMLQRISAAGPIILTDPHFKENLLFALNSRIWQRFETAGALVPILRAEAPDQLWVAIDRLSTLLENSSKS